jgi:indole-3-glycerol phosphate synthase
MSNILEEIIANKKKEVALKKQMFPVDVWKNYPHYREERLSLKKSLLQKNSTGIIAEFKRKSPSKGIINASAEIEDVVSAYDISAAGISVLTDEKYFGGANDDLVRAREIVSTPLVRKDFIVDEYQLEEAKGIGADVILLIAACLTKEEVKKLAQKAKSLGFEVLLEIHDEKELEHICDEADLIGINNRNLKTFEVNIETSINLFQKISKEKIVIAESGINNVETIITLRSAGFKGFLIGENFMKQPDPTIAFAEFIEQLKAKTT